MDGYVYSKTISAIAIRAFLTKPSAPLEYILQESAASITFERFATPGEDWLPWDKGRAFGLEVEVRWQRIANEQFHLLVLSEVRQEPLVKDGWRERVMQAEGGDKIYLWGRHLAYLIGAEDWDGPDEWVEASIPRPLRYPLRERKEFASIEAVRYRQDGMIVLTRFRQLTGEDGKEVGQ